MITLVTGIPGSGKTAYVVDWLLSLPKERPIFCDGVPDLALEHEVCPPLPDWTHEEDDASSQSGKKISFTFPVGSVVVLDEAQRVYRPRATGSKVPPEVAAFETHRHLGLDFILITQSPGLIDSNIRKLVGRHVHFRVTWAGRYMHEWNECQDVESSSARSLAATTRYTLPKRAFAQYKSAEQHTKHKAKIPIVVYVLIAAVLALGFFGWRVYSRVSGAINGEAVATSKPAASSRPGSAGRAPGTSPVGPMTVAEYVQAQKPRIPGLLHSAPVYDGVTQPKEAPIPVGCVLNHRTKTCRCIDQQGNSYRTEAEICGQIVSHGMFVSWRADQPDREPVRSSGGSAGHAVTASTPLPSPVPVAAVQKEGV